jgi:sugar-specific transcriptional regulator TrmB
MYEQELQEIGLTKNEVKIYLALLRKGALNPTKLAEITGLHRSYVYDTLDRLLEQGIINTILIKSKKHYQAVNPKVLRESIELRLKQVDSIIPALSSMFEAEKEETHIELHKGRFVYRTLIKDLISNLVQGDSVYLTGIDEGVLKEVEPIYLKAYFRIIKEKKVKERIIVAKGSKRLRKSSLQYRALDRKYIGETATVIHGNKIYLFILGHPNHLIIINSREVADTYLKNFQLLWDKSITS